MEDKRYPLLLSPAYKDYLWGGESLKRNYSKNTDVSTLAESWECSCHPDGESTVANGELSGQTLWSVLNKNPDWLGTRNDAREGFPILFKLIDAKKDLSIQVHPDDKYAHENEGQRGKTEMWYVLDAEPQAQIIYRFKNKLDRDTLISSAKDGTIKNHLRAVKAKKGDVFFISPGTVHAIGAGLTIAEIQQNSNLTYRLWDYGRRDAAGNLRPMHLDKAADVINYDDVEVQNEPVRVIEELGTSKRETLASCKYFCVKKITANGVYDTNIDATSFYAFFCAEGKGTLAWYDGETDIKKGDTIFVPASLGSLRFTGNAELLEIN